MSTQKATNFRGNHADIITDLERIIYLLSAHLCYNVGTPLGVPHARPRQGRPIFEWLDRCTLRRSQTGGVLVYAGLYNNTGGMVN